MDGPIDKKSAGISFRIFQSLIKWSFVDFYCVCLDIRYSLPLPLYVPYYYVDNRGGCFHTFSGWIHL